VHAGRACRADGVEAVTGGAGDLTDRTGGAVVPATSIGPDAAVLILDATGRIQSIGGTTERIFGYVASEILGKPVELLLPHARAGQDGNLLDTYLNKHQATHLRYGHEILARRRDGKTFTADLGILPSRAGGQVIPIRKRCSNVRICWYVPLGMKD